MEPQCRPLLATFHDIPEPRQARGRRPPLAAIWALTCVAMLGGDRTYSAMAEWGRSYGQQRARALGCTRDTTPCAATLYHVLRPLDRPLVEAALGAWAESGLLALPPDRQHGVGGDTAGPGLAQVVQVERHATLKTRGAQRHEVVYGVVGRGPDRDRPGKLNGPAAPKWRSIACARRSLFL